jgi:hypothetical protein
MYQEHLVRRLWLLLLFMLIELVAVRLLRLETGVSNWASLVRRVDGAGAVSWPIAPLLGDTT